MNDASGEDRGGQRVPAAALLHERRHQDGDEQDPQERQDVRQVELEHRGGTLAARPSVTASHRALSPLYGEFRALRSWLSCMTRVVVIDPQPAVRAGLAMLLRTEPGLVPVGAAVGAHDGLELVTRQRPDVVLLDPQLLDGDGLGMCRRLRALDPAPRVVLYTAGGDPTLPSRRASPAPTGWSTRPRRRRGALRGDPARRPRRHRAAAAGPRGSSTPPPTSVDAEDLALLAMLVDRTEPAEVAATLRLDRSARSAAHRAAARAPARAPGRARTPPDVVTCWGTCLSSPWSSSAPPVASANSTSSRGC